MVDIKIEESRKVPFNPEPNGKAKTPPRTTTRGPNADAPTMVQIQHSLEDFYVLLGSMAGSIPNPRVKMVGDSIVLNGPKCAESLVEAAKKDPRLKRILIQLTTAGAYSGILIAHTPIILATIIAFQAPESAFKPPETVDADTATDA